MGDLIYSPGALDTLPQFHRIALVIYVEGEDDVPFWNKLLEDCGFAGYLLKIAGGAPTLDKYARAIVEADASICVCRDLDFLDLAQASLTHPRVLYTYGYSIENTLCNADTLSLATRALLKTVEDMRPAFEAWATELEEAIKPLIVLDVAFRLKALGITVPLNNVHMYTGGQGKHLPMQAKVKEQCEALCAHLASEDIEDAASKLDRSQKRLAHHVRGHFLLSCALAMISQDIRKKKASRNLPTDTFFALLLTSFDLSHLTPQEQAHYIAQLEGLKT